MFGIANPVIKKIWNVFGHGTYTDTLMDDNKFFDEKWNFRSYKEHLMNENINGIENVRFVYMNFPNRHPLLIRRFMKLWKDATCNYLSGISFRTFLSSPSVKSSLDFVLPNTDLLFFGISIVKIENLDSDKDLEPPSEISIEKFAIPDMTMKQSWKYFARKDKILVIQNPLTDEFPIPYQNSGRIINPDMMKLINTEMANLLHTEMKEAENMPLNEFFGLDRIRKILGINHDGDFTVSFSSEKNRKEIARIHVYKKVFDIKNHRLVIQ